MGNALDQHKSEIVMCKIRLGFRKILLGIQFIRIIEKHQKYLDSLLLDVD